MSVQGTFPLILSISGSDSMTEKISDVLDFEKGEKGEGYVEELSRRKRKERKRKKENRRGKGRKEVT